MMKAAYKWRKKSSAAADKHNFVRLDVVDEAQHHAAVAAAVKAFGKLDGSCSAAGMPFQGRPIHQIDPDFWERVYSLNLRSLFFALRAQVPAMLEAGKGSIVYVASTAAIAAFPGAADYCAMKGGAAAAARAAALDYSKLGIRVNSVLPGATRTPMMEGQFNAFEGLEDAVVGDIPLGRIAEPDEIAFAVRWLLSDEASFVTGSMMVVDGGLTAK